MLFYDLQFNRRYEGVVAKVTGGFYRFYMTSIDFSEVTRGHVSHPKDVVLKFSYGNDDFSILRGHFRFDGSGAAVAGTVKRMQLGDQYDHISVRGLEVPLQLIFKVSMTKQQDDDARLWRKILSGDDEISSIAYHSTLYGFGGDDVVSGAGGRDSLNGGKGHDILYGRLGADTLTGGHGADYFLYEAITDSFDRAADLITDFSQAQGDKIWLNDFDAIDIENEIRIVHRDGETHIELDGFNGNEAMLMLIKLQGQIDLTLNDFIFD